MGGEKVLEAEWIMKNLLSDEVEEVLEGELSDQNDLEKYEVVVVKLKFWRRYSYWCQYLWGVTMGWVTQVGKVKTEGREGHSIEWIISTLEVTLSGAAVVERETVNHR